MRPRQTKPRLAAASTVDDNQDKGWTQRAWACSALTQRAVPRGRPAGASSGRVPPCLVCPVRASQAKVSEGFPASPQATRPSFAGPHGPHETYARDFPQQVVDLNPPIQSIVGMMIDNKPVTRDLAPRALTFHYPHMTGLHGCSQVAVAVAGAHRDMAVGLPNLTHLAEAGTCLEWNTRYAEFRQNQPEAVLARPILFC